MKRGGAVQERDTVEIGAGAAWAACLSAVSAHASDPEAVCGRLKADSKAWFKHGPESYQPTVEEVKRLCDECEADQQKYEPLMGAQGANVHGALMRPDAGKMESFRPITEAVQVAEDKREIRCNIISEGLGNQKDMNFYSATAVRQFAEKLNASRSFINHATPAEESARPEGSLWNQAGYWKDVAAELVEGLVTAVGTLCLDQSKAGDEGMADIRHAIRMATDFPGIREVYCGISVNGDGETERRTITIDGQEVEVNYVTAITKAGADLVTQPARGGKILGLLESIRNSKDPQEGTTIMKEALKKALAGIAERFKALSEAEDTSAQGVLDMLKESAVQLKTVAKANGEELKEGDGDKKDEEKDEKKEEEKDEEKDKKKDEKKEEEKDEEKDKKKDEKKEEEKDEDDEEKTDESKKESATVRDLRLKLKEAKGKLDNQAITASIKEAGLEGEVTVEELAAFSPDQRKVMLNWKRQMSEAAGFSPIGTTQRGTGARGGSQPGDSFVAGVSSRTGARG